MIRSPASAQGGVDGVDDYRGARDRRGRKLLHLRRVRANGADMSAWSNVLILEDRAMWSRCR